MIIAVIIPWAMASILSYPLYSPFDSYFLDHKIYVAGYFVYFVLTLVAACKGWTCWSQSCGFIVMGMIIEIRSS